jgi:hypothetical protein
LGDNQLNIKQKASNIEPQKEISLFSPQQEHTMDKTTIQEVLASLKKGDKFEVTFTENAKNFLFYLVGMLNSGFLTIREQEGVVLELALASVYAVATSKNWDMVEKTFSFTINSWGTDKQEWFLERLGLGIERIRKL